jgi:hypothetical protein
VKFVNESYSVLKFINSIFIIKMKSKNFKEDSNLDEDSLSQGEDYKKAKKTRANIGETLNELLSRKMSI